MNIIQDNIDAGKRNLAGSKPMVVKPTVIGNALMPPPSRTVKKYTTPSSSRSGNKDAGQSSTPRTKSTPTVHRDTHIIMSICEGRGKAACSVGIAAVDIHRPVLILSQILDTKTYTATLTKINVLRPVELLVPASFIEGATQSRLVSMIVAQFPNLMVNAIPRSEFNRGRGLHSLKTICAGAFSSVILQIDEKFYSLAASCALLRYVEQSRRIIYSPKTVKIEYQEPEHTTAIDIDTANLLELTSSSGRQNVSLFTVLNYCSTIPGKKLLRTNILQPPRRKDLIETRLDCVQELLDNPNSLTRLQETLKPLSDIESALTFGTVLPSTASTVSERQLNYTLQLKGLLIAVQPLAEELKATKHPVFRYIYNRIEGLDTRQKILSLISEVINEDAHLAKGQAGELQRCFAIKSGINGFLDLSRRLYTEGVDAMRAYVDELTEKYNLPLRVQHTIKNGFHIILPLTKALRNLKKTDLPPIFTKVERLSSHFYLTTMDMINFDKRLKNNSYEIQNISNVIIYQLLVSIRPFIGDLYNLCEDVGQLDMLVSLARVSSLPNWVRPKIVDCYMRLEGARHPILEHVAEQEPVANSIYAYPRLRLHILTGPNMSGKSILLHSISLIQILLQVGCFVPCSSACLRVCDRVYARVSDNDPHVTIQASSFAVEMEKMAYLLNTVQETSLVLVDEMCKTTGCDEAVPLAMGICERLISVGCFAFVATHYAALTVLEDMYPNVANWHLETLEENRANNTRISLKFTYKLLPGITTIEGYGIKLSRIFNSSKSISDRAESLYNYLLPSRKSLASGNTVKSPEFQKYKLQSQLDLLKIKNQLTDEILKDLVENFQQKTGLSFEPSPISIQRSSEVNQSISKKTSSTSDKKNTNSWAPTPKSNSTSSNHEFSVPGSSKTSDKDNIFGEQKSDDSFQYADLSFNSDVSSIHKMNDSQKSSHKNYFFNNSAFMPNKQDSELSSAKNTMFARSLKSVNFIVDSTQSCTENNQTKNVSVSSFENIINHNNLNENSPDIFEANPQIDPEVKNVLNGSSMSNLSEKVPYTPKFTIVVNKSLTKNSQDIAVPDTLKFNPDSDAIFQNISNSSSSQINKNLTCVDAQEISDISNWTSSNNTMFNKTKNSLNLTVSSTPRNSEKSAEISQNKSVHTCEKSSSIPSSYNTLYSKLPVTASVNSAYFQNEENNTSISSSMLNTSSPILNKNNPKKPRQIKLVSNLYDSETDSENSVIEIVEIDNKDDSIIVHNKDNSELCSPDELNFSSYLNLREGITSTPKTSKDLTTTQYFTSNSKENSLADFQSPVKRKLTLPPLDLPQKLKKILSPIETSTSNSTFRTCNSLNSSQQNVKKYPLGNFEDTIFDQETVRLNDSD